MSVSALIEDITASLSRLEALQAELRQCTDELLNLTGAGFLADRLKDWPSHPQAGICPECGQDCTRISLADLVCTFEACSCGRPRYRHLVEQLHHRRCYPARRETRVWSLREPKRPPKS